MITKEQTIVNGFVEGKKFKTICKDISYKVVNNIDLLIGEDQIKTCINIILEAIIIYAKSTIDIIIIKDPLIGEIINIGSVKGLPVLYISYKNLDNAYKRNGYVFADDYDNRERIQEMEDNKEDSKLLYYIGSNIAADCIQMKLLREIIISEFFNKHKIKINNEYYIDNLTIIIFFDMIKYLLENKELKYEYDGINYKLCLRGNKIHYYKNLKKDIKIF